jgi:hypothetical protein
MASLLLVLKSGFLAANHFSNFLKKKSKVYGYVILEAHYIQSLKRIKLFISETFVDAGAFK